MRKGPKDADTGICDLSESSGGDILPLTTALTGFPAAGVNRPSLDDHTGNPSVLEFCRCPRRNELRGRRTGFVPCPDPEDSVNETRELARGTPDTFGQHIVNNYSYPSLTSSTTMQTPLRLTFRHLDSSTALEARVRDLAARLERFHDRIIGCQVVIEAPPGHSSKGGPFTVKIEVTVPGGAINANSAHALHPEHADVYVALRDAFDSVARQLQNYAPVH